MGRRGAAVGGSGLKGPQRVVLHARQLIGVPWRHQGRKPWAVDCVGLVVLSLRGAGWPSEIAVPARYGREPWDGQLRGSLQHHFGDCVHGDMQPGDIALFRWGKSQPSHVGITADYVYGGLSIIHASTREGVIETALSGRIREGLIEAYRPSWGEL